MPDYSGYAQRQQQDPNLAAWAQIGGNIANIFGLDPAKAAEARRGLQQEDYNEERRQATLRQQAANKRIGQLLAGSGFDTARGEFRDPAAWAEFVQNMGEMGDARQAVSFAPGRAAQAEKDVIDRENRIYKQREDIANTRAEAEAAKAKERADAVAAAEKERLYRSLVAHSGRDLQSVFSPSVAIENFKRYRTKGDPASGLAPLSLGSELTEDNPDAPGQKRISARGMEWLNKAGLSENAVHPNVLSRMSGANYASEKDALAKQVAADLMIPGPDGHLSPAVQDLVQRLYASQLNSRASDDVIAPVSSPQQFAKILADKSAKYALVRFPVTSTDGQVSYRYLQYDVEFWAPKEIPADATPQVRAAIEAENLAKRNSPQNPINLFRQFASPVR